MINIYDSQAIIKSYKLLYKKCDVLDKLIKNHAVYFTVDDAEYSATNVYNHIIELMERKNQLINLKIIIDTALKKLSEMDKKILYLKMNYNHNIENICNILNLSERTAFRKIEQAFNDLTIALNNSEYANHLAKILKREDWITNLKTEISTRHQNIKQGAKNKTKKQNYVYASEGVLNN